MTTCLEVFLRYVISSHVFSMMFELIPFDCSGMVLLAEVSAKWINFDYLSLTSFDFCKSLIAAFFSVRDSKFPLGASRIGVYQESA